MSEFLPLAPAWAVGLFIGTIFFGGLWWTVRKGVSSERPALWFFGSMLLRMSIALAGFCLVSGGHWERLLACLLGFVIARFMVTSLTGPLVAHRDVPATEAGHAP